MYRTTLFLSASAVLLSLSLAHAANKGTLTPDKAVGITAEHQSNDEADVTITRRIRQAVVKDDALSLYAQNVKIITVDGLVLLKGPVRNDEEKIKVEHIAQDVAGKDQVTSEIVVAR
jgi:osmotically-inducible protein OsmY